MGNCGDLVALGNEVVSSRVVLLVRFYIPVTKQVGKLGWIAGWLVGICELHSARGEAGKHSSIDCANELFIFRGSGSIVSISMDCALEWQNESSESGKIAMGWMTNVHCGGL